MNNNNKNQKFRQLVATATELFMRFGIRRVSVEEICAEAGVSKMTFYKYFKNKIELSKYLLTQIYTESLIEYRNIMAQQIPYVEKVKLIIQMKHNQTTILSQEFFNDFSKNPNPEIAALLERLKAESLNEILKDFKVAIKNGNIRQNLKPEFILYFLNHLNEMIKDPQLLNLYNSPNELIMELTNFFFYGILTPHEN